MANENINPIIKNSSGGDSDNSKKYVSILTDNSIEGGQDYYIKDLEAQIKLENKLEKPENITAEELLKKIDSASLEVGRDYIVSYGSNNVVVNALSSKIINETAKLIVVTENKEYDIKYCIVTKDSAEERFSGYFTDTDFNNTDAVGIIYWMRDPETRNEAPWDWVTTSTSPFANDSNNIIIKPYIKDNKYTKPTIPSLIDGYNKIIDLNSIHYKSSGRIDIGDNSTTTHIGLHINKEGIENYGGRVSIYLPDGALFNFGYNENKEKYFKVHDLDKIYFSSSNFTTESDVSFEGGTEKTFSCSIPTNFTSGIVGSGGYICLYNNNSSSKTEVFKVDKGGNTIIGGGLDVNESIKVGKNGGGIPKVVVFKNVENSDYGLCIGQGTDNTLSICRYNSISNNLKNNLNNNYYLKINNDNGIIINKDFNIVTNGSNTNTKKVFSVNHSTGDTNIFGNFEIKNNSGGEFVKVDTTGQISLKIPETLDNNSKKQKRFTVYAASSPIFNAGYMNDLPQIWTSSICERINLYSKGIVLGESTTENINIYGKNLTIYSNDVTINSNTVLKNNLTLTRSSSNTPIIIKLDNGIESQGNPEQYSEHYSHLFGGFAVIIPRGKDTDGKVNQRWRFYGRADDNSGTPRNFLNIGFSNGKLGVSSASSLEFFNITHGTTTIKDLTVNNISKLGGTLNVSGATTLNNSLSVNGVTILNSSLIVGNDTTLKSSLNVISATTLGNTLNVEGATTLKNSLNVTGNTVLKSSLDVTSATKLGGTLDVTGNLRVGPNDDSNDKMIYTGGLQTNGDAEVGGNLQVYGNIKTNDTLVATSLVVSSTNSIIIKTIKKDKELSITNGKVTSDGGFFDTSDGRLKTNLSPIKVNLDSLSKLQKVHFDWKDKEKMGSSRQLGMIAQEVQELYPELISTSEDGTLSLAYDKLGVIALEAIDLLHKENKELKARLEKLESLIHGGE